MSNGFYASDEELELVGRIYDRAGCSRPGFISGESLVEIFAENVGLTTAILSQIWSIVDEGNTGNLSERGLSVAIRLIGWAQRGEVVNIGLINIPGPLPHIKGITDVGSTPERSPASANSEWPPLTQRSLELFRKSFQDNGPSNGLLDGEKVRDIFLQSNLSPKDLWHIWNLIDTQKRGALDSNEFSLAMYLIQGVISGKLSSIPALIPDHIREMIFSSEGEGEKAFSPSALQRQDPAPPEAISRPVVDPIIIPSISRKDKPLPIPENPFQLDWDVTPSEKSFADRDFYLLDSEKQGFIERDAVAKFMLKFRLPPKDLTHIWDLAGLNNDNHLTREGFAVAMHLVQRKLSGAELPFVLPLSLIPPSMRATKAIDKPSQSIKAINMSSASGSPTTPSTRRPPPLPPKPISPTAGSLRRSHSAVSNPNVDNVGPSRQDRRIPSERQPLTVPLDQYRDLDREKLLLSSKVKELTVQLNAQHDLLMENNELKKENETLYAKLQDVEQTVSQLLQATERLPEVTHQNALLLHRMADMEHLRLELNETSRRLESSTQESKDLRTRLREAREMAETVGSRSAVEIEVLKRKVERLEEENQRVKDHAHVMERAIRQSQSSGAATSMQELQILMGDVTRENEQLKARIRDTQRSTAQVFLSTSSSLTVNDDLRRDNLRLEALVQELEQVANQLQSSSEDGELQRMLRDVTHENEELKVRIREMREEISLLRSSPSGRVEGPQREIEDLKEEVRRLRTELQSAVAVASGQPEEEDTTIPPPAYNDEL